MLLSAAWEKQRQDVLTDSDYMGPNKVLQNLLKLVRRPNKTNMQLLGSSCVVVLPFLSVMVFHCVVNKKSSIQNPAK